MPAPSSPPLLVNKRPAMHNSAAAEYIPQPDERTNGNGHFNGNGHSNGQPFRQKNFEIKPSTDPDTLKILEARDKALGDPALSRPVRAFVCFIVDRCLNPRFYDEKGVVCMADSIAAEKFGVTVRTIYDWRHWPGIDRYFWFSKKGRPNMWPMMVYHLTCLHAAPRFEQRTDAGGTYAGGASDRVAPGQDVAAVGREKRNAALASKRAQKTLPLSGGIAVVEGAKVPVAPGPIGSRPAIRLPKSARFRAISAQARKMFRRIAEESFGPPPKKISAGSRSKFRPGAEENFGGEPKKISAGSRNGLQPSAEADCRHLESQIGDSGVSLRGGEGKPPQDGTWEADFKEWRDGLRKLFPAELKQIQIELQNERTRLSETAAKQAGAHGKAGPRCLEALDRVGRKLDAIKAKLTGPR